LVFLPTFVIIVHFENRSTSVTKAQRLPSGKEDSKTAHSSPAFFGISTDFTDGGK
jgi:hypothetical protein